MTGSTSIENINAAGAKGVGSTPTPSASRRCSTARSAAMSTDGSILLGFAAQNEGELKVVGDEFSEERIGVGYCEGRPGDVRVDQRRARGVLRRRLLGRGVRDDARRLEASRRPSRRRSTSAQPDPTADPAGAAVTPRRPPRDRLTTLRGARRVDAVFDNFDLFLRAFGYTIFAVRGLRACCRWCSAPCWWRCGSVRSPCCAGAAAIYVTLVRNTPLRHRLRSSSASPARRSAIRFEWRRHPHRRVRLHQRSSRACVAALTLYTSTFVCEALRSGVNAVPLGQAEAARAIGLPFTGVMREVVLPQAFRASVPPLASVQIALLKNTSVAAASACSRRSPGCALHQRLPDPADRHLHHVRARLRRARRGLLVRRQPARAPLGGGPMSASVLFDAPGPRTVARHRIYPSSAASSLLGGARVGGLAARRQRPVRVRQVGAVRHPALHQRASWSTACSRP